ncbi:MAG TPA: CorA family divalent cation transporter, partial [Candidatus Limnocylindria bacterium]|nr:CorA family divalent cation transporter [Candidatus Limnocylindria bacterium]
MHAIASPEKRTPSNAGKDTTNDASRPGEAMVRARRFDADRHDQVLSLEAALEAKVTSRHLLWIDIEGDLDSPDGERMAKRFALDRRTRQALEEGQDGPFLSVNGRYLHVRVAAEPNPADSTTAWLDIIAGEDVVITRHDRPLGFLIDYDDRIEADTALGTLGSVTFLGSLLDDAITSYHAAVDRIEDQVDVLDTRSLRDAARGNLLDDLVQLRRRIARLRRLLADHRAVFAALASRDVGEIAADEDG